MTMRYWWAFFGLALLVALLELATSGLWLPGVIRREAIQWATYHHQRLTIGAVRVSLYPLRLHIEQAHLYEPDGTTEELGFGALDVILSWRSLWHAMPVLDTVSVTQPVVHLVRGSSGEWNVATLLASSSSGMGGVLPVLVEHVRLSGGEVTVLDLQQGLHHALHDVNVEIPLLATRGFAADRWVDVTLAMRADEAPVKLMAQFQTGSNWKVRGEVDSKDLDVESWLSPWLPLGSWQAVNGRRLGLHSDFLVESVAGDWQATLRQLTVDWQGRSIVEPFVVDGDRVRWVVQGAHISVHRITWDHATLTGDGLEIATRLPAHQPDWHFRSAGWSLAVGRMVARTAAQGVWTLEVESPQVKLSLLNLGCAGDKKTCQKQPLRLALSSLQGSLDSFRWPWAGNVLLTAQGEVGHDGRFSVTGPWNGAQGTGTLQLAATDIPLILAQPLITPYAGILVDRGKLALQGKLFVGEHRQPGHIRYHGSVQVDGLVLRDRRRAQLLWNSKTLYLGAGDLEVNPLALTLNQVAISDFYARVMLMPDGSLNLKSLFGQSGQPTEALSRSGSVYESVAVRSVSKDRIVPVEVHKITLQEGRVHYKDQFVHPMFEVDLTHLGGVIAGLSSTRRADAVVDLRGRVNGAPLQIKGTVNPLASTTHMDLNARVSGMDLSMFSPYSGKYVGYDIERGKLSFDVTYRIQDGHLNADNHLILNQLTFGRPVASDTAAHFPVELAASLLKDSQGNINVNLPIEGSLNDPRFSVGEVLARTMVHLLEHALESPFAMLGRWFEQRDSVSWLTFAPGSAVLGADQQGRLVDVLHSLQSQTHARLDLQGCTDRELDGPILQRQILMKKILAARLRAQSGFHGAQSPESWSADEYARWLGKAYQAETFPKPKNLLGFDQTLSVAGMEKLMLANSQLSQGQLDQLAQRRVEVVQDWLTHHGIGAHRVYPVRESAQDRSIGQDVSRARVDCILHP